MEKRKKDALDIWDQTVNGFKDGIDKIKGFFSGLDLSLPDIKMPKMPKFKITGGFDLNTRSVPSVDWYDKGGIFTGPQVIGVGEKRPEFVGALEDLEVIVKKQC